MKEFNIKICIISEGGGLYIVNGTIFASKWIFGDNVAQRGGAVFLSNSSVTLSGTSVSDDAKEGTAIYAVNSKVWVVHLIEN